MIHIDFPEPQTQAWQKWRRKCEAAREELVRKVENGEKPKFTDLYKGMKAEVYVNPNGPFHGKCAYCEQAITNPHNQPGDVEHFRPKGRVTNEDGTPVVVRDDGGAREHPGYYWLAYDWRNLLPSCNGCNRKQTDPHSGTMIGKGMVFPVRNFRAIRPGEEAREEPLLLHPVWDDPEEHLDMDSTGVFATKTERGEVTERVLGLNLRGLPGARKETYEKTKMRCAKLLLLDRNGEGAKTTREKLRDGANGVGEHTIAVRKAIADAAAEMARLAS